MFTAASMLGTAWMNCVGGVQFTMFATMLMAHMGPWQKDFHFGILNAVPYVAMLGQFIGSALIEKYGYTKQQFIQTGVVHRMMWLVIAAIPLIVPVPSTLAVWVLIGAMMLSSFMSSIMAPAGLVWSGDLIPRRIRGRYYANRSMYGRPVQIGTVILLGVVLHVFGKQEAGTAWGQPVLLWIICGIFAVAAFVGAGDILLCSLVRQVVPTVKHGRGQRRQVNIKALLIEPMRDRLFRTYAMYSATLSFAMGFMGLFLWRNVTDNLEFGPLMANFLFLVVSPVLGLIGARAWGRGIDRWGTKPILVIATIGTWITVVPWLLASPGIPAPAWVASAVNATGAWIALLAGREGVVLLGPEAPVGGFLVACIAAITGGIAWTGVALAQNNVALGFSDSAGRSRYIAASSVITSIGGGLGALTAGLVAGYVGQMLAARGLAYVEWGVFRWNQWHAAFAFSFVFRGISLLWLIRLPSDGRGSTRQLAGQMLGSFYNAVASWVYYPVRILGWGSAWRAANRHSRRAPSSADADNPDK